ncbi:MAG: hypothetical protein J7K20_01985 [Thermodesulfobacterium sp.]|nr:hypothetical protein [Thermodesulfobacterium sp.]
MSKKQNKKSVRMEVDKKQRMVLLYLNGKKIKEVKIPPKVLKEVKNNLGDVKTLRRLTSPYAKELYTPEMPRRYYNSTRLAICRLVK